MTRISIFDYMEDWDNAELPDYERDEQLMEAVRDYNEEHGTNHDPQKALIKYKSVQRKKYLYDIWSTT